jgi:hypothetical protein
LLRLQPHFVGALGLRLAARRDEIRIADDFRVDEPLLDVRRCAFYWRLFLLKMRR